MKDVFLKRFIAEEGNLCFDESQTLKQHWPIGDDAALKKKADFGLTTLVGDHMVFIAEVKTSENRLTHDLKKVAFCMRATIDRSQQLGFVGASVCGLWVQGEQYRVLYMDHVFGGGYRLLEVFAFQAPRYRNDLQRVPQFYKGLLVLEYVI